MTILEYVNINFLSSCRRICAKFCQNERLAIPYSKLVSNCSRFLLSSFLIVLMVVWVVLVEVLVVLGMFLEHVK